MSGLELSTILVLTVMMLLTANGHVLDFLYRVQGGSHYVPDPLQSKRPKT